MKKTFCSLLVIFFIFSFVSAKEDFISFNAGISSGLPFYGEKSIPEKSSDISTEYRAIIGCFANVNLNVIKQVSFFAGADMLSDFNWLDSQYNNHLHVNFPLGFKIYPGLGGFNLGLSYTLGFRADFLKESTGEKTNNIASWGNGFKLHMEYNFAHEGKTNYLPTMGCSWNLMPRGNYSYDNILTFYLAENF